MLQTATPIGVAVFAYGMFVRLGMAALADIRALARCAAEIDDITSLAVLRHE